MDFRRARWLLGVLVLALPCLYLMGCGSEAKIIPREVLMGNPEKASPQISPGGTMLAYIAPVDDILNIWVKTIGTDDDRPVTDDTERGIYRYFWSQDGKYIMYLRDVGGNENWQLYRADIETGDNELLTPYEGVQVQIVEYDKHHPDEMLIAMNKDDKRLFDVYHLDLTNGDTRMVARNPGNIVGWLVDFDFNLRGALATTPEGGWDLLVRPNEKASWNKVLTWGPDDALSSGPESFTKDGGHMYCIDSRDVNAARLVKIDLDTGKVVEVLAEDPVYDVSGVVINPDTYEAQAALFLKDRIEWVVLDDNIRKDVELIGELQDGDFFIRSRDHDDRKWVVGFTVDDGPVAYYTWDRSAKDGKFLFYHRPELAEYTLSKMEPVSFTSRDGLIIHGYMTYPPSGSRKDLPMVLLVHGGPWARDTWGYNPEAQWLANRGYVCFQINYRGSTGYGKEFLNAGDKEWGGKMHNDLVDGVHWAEEQGIADSVRVGIFGGSYGGYAALVGATFTPDLFACAVAAVGPSNLVTFIETIPPYWTPMLDMFYRRVGNPETEREFLESRSPLFKVDQIKIPMLIAQGANDPRVNKAESDQIVEAMKQKGIDYEYLVFEDEGHGFLKEENRLEFYAAAEKFLADNLGGVYEPMPEQTMKQ
jgi:dipeptidyl aminopeptidase/acylaminoacyl peptidase